MDISLLHAGLAAGAAMAALPVILHLFMRQTPKHVIFPALRLIRERQKRSRKKLRVKNWLLLLARMALIALMALALARPALHSQASLGDREVPTALALVFDTSLSMEYTERNATRLDDAKAQAEAILKTTPSTSLVFVIDSAEPGAPIPLSPSAARKRVGELKLRPANRPLNGALGHAYRVVAESDRPRREVYVLTDLARSAWDLGRKVDGLDEAKKVKTGVATYVLRLTPRGARDAAVVEARPSATVAVEGEPVEIRATIQAEGPAQERVVELYLNDDKGRPTKRGQKAITIPADGRVEVPFQVPSTRVGLHQGEVRLGGNDPMAFDDVRYFSFEIQPPRRVLVVSDRRLDAEFVVQALDPSELRAGRDRPFQVDRATADQLGERLRSNPASYACIFLLNVRQLGDDAWSKLNLYVRQGGGLVIAPGDRADPASYNGPGASQVVPATLEKPIRPADPLVFGKLDPDHPLFRRYGKDLPADLSGVPIYRYWTIAPAEGARTLLAYQDGKPALIERVFQGLKTGRVLLWTTPLARVPDSETRNWNDFPMLWSFFAVVNQSVPYLAGVTEARLSFEAGENVDLPIDPNRRASTYVVQGPEKAMTSRLSPSAASATLPIQAPQALGQWSVSAAEPGSSSDSTTAPRALGFSVNPPTDEAQIAALEPAQLDSLFGKDNYALADDPEKLEKAVGLTRVGRELFPWIMALILALVTAENFLANRFYRERVKG